jgi:hypothetical protein
MSKLVCFGHTRFIPKNHVLRHIGENGDAPPGYFGNGTEMDTEKETNQALSRQYKASGAQIEVSAKAPSKRGKKKKGKESNKKEKKQGPPLTSQVVNVPTVHTKRKLNMKLYKWYNSDFPFHLFEDAMWVAYNDPRTYEPFRRQLHEVYVANGIEAMESRKLCKGVHSLSKWAALQYGMKMEYMCYDMMHVIALSMLYFLSVMKGHRALSVECRQMAILLGRFPFLKSDKSTPGWLVSGVHQGLADSVQNAILVPPKYSDYRFQYIFKHSGKVNSYNKMMFAKTFIGFVLSFTDMSAPYQWFFRRYASDLCGMVNPVIQNAAVPKLCNSVVETRVIHECIFPDSEQQFILHELLEIVHQLKTFGVVDPLSCRTGERSLQEFAAGVPRGGGKNFLKTTEERFVAKEQAKAHDTAEYKKNLEFYTDNRGRYSPLVLKLYGNNPKHISWSTFAKDNMFSAVFEFVNTQEIDHLQLRSPFCRLYLVHSTMTDTQGFKYKSFSEWIDKIYSVYLTSAPFYSKHVKHLVNGVKQHQPEYVEDIDDDIADGIIYMTDFCGIIKDIACYGDKKHKVKIFFEATIKGIHFDGRGSEYAEDTIEVETFKGNQSNKAGLNKRAIANERNILSYTWDYNVGSWCLVTDAYQPNDSAASRQSRKTQKKVSAGKTGRKTRTGKLIEYRRYAALLNYFFRLVLPTDPVLHGLSLASAFLRKLDDSRNVDEGRGGHYFVHSDDSIDYHPHKQFIVLNYVDSTAIGVCGLDESGMPIISDTCNAKWVNDKYLTFSKEPLDKLFILPLHPERLIPNLERVHQNNGDDQEGEDAVVFEKGYTNTTDYDTIDKDVDGTKVFEK